MTQLNHSTTNTTPLMHNSEEEIFTYKDSQVKIITVFNDAKETTALVEDENGEIFQVLKDDFFFMIHVTYSFTYLQIYLLSISILSFILYGYDKFQSFKNTKNITRVSENKLLLSSFIGGTIGSLLAMLIFRHKVKKISFIIKFLLVIIMQIIIIFLYLRGFIYILTQH